jgi:hypothetical protein
MSNDMKILSKYFVYFVVKKSYLFILHCYFTSPESVSRVGFASVEVFTVIVFWKTP